MKVQDQIFWSRWNRFESLKDRTKGKRPGVYEFRCLGKNGKPLAITRTRGVDQTGLIYIGRRLGRLRSRISSFYRHISGQSRGGHTASRHYLCWEFSRVFPLKRLEVRYAEMSSNRVKQAEKDLIHAYLRRYLDLPPLNFQLPATIEAPLKSSR